MQRDLYDTKKKNVTGSILNLSSWAALTSMRDYMSTQCRLECICWIDQEDIDDRQLVTNSSGLPPQIISLAFCHRGTACVTLKCRLWDCSGLSRNIGLSVLKPSDFPVVLLLKAHVLEGGLSNDVACMKLHQGSLAALNINVVCSINIKWTLAVCQVLGNQDIN